MKKFRQFIKELLSGSDGWISTKRVALFLVLFTWLFFLFFNFFTHTDLEANFKAQLFNILTFLIGAVFGEQITNAVKSFSKNDEPKS